MAVFKPGHQSCASMWILFITRKGLNLGRTYLLHPVYLGGTTAEKLYADYRDMVGEGIPYRRLGYDTLNNFLKSIPDYCKTTRNNKVFFSPYCILF